MLKPDEINAQLDQWKVKPEDKLGGFSDRLTDPINKLPKKLSKIAFGILGYYSTREGDANRWDETPEGERFLKEARITFEEMPERDRKMVFTVIAPRLSEQLEAAWQFQKSAPYQIGYGRRAFRAPENPDLSLDARILWLQELSNILKRFQAPTLTATWLAQWTPHAFPYLGKQVAPILAAAIDSGSLEGKEVFDILCRTVTREDPIGIMGEHVITSLLMASKPEGWELMEKTLLAAQRQEGLRQSILEHADLAHPEAFVRLMKVILEHDLVRFSSAARSINVWFGLLWDSSSTKILKENVEKITTLIASTAERKKALASSHAETVYRALWATAFLNGPAAVPLATHLLKAKSEEIRFVATWCLTILGLKSASAAKTFAIDDPNLQVALTAAVSAGGIKITNDMGELKASDASGERLFDHLERLYQRLPEKPTPLKALVWPWTERVAERSMLAVKLLMSLGDLPPTRYIPYLADLDPWNRRTVIDLLASQEKWDQLTRTALLDLAGDSSADVRSAAFRVLEKAALDPAEVLRIESYLTRKADDLRQGVTKLLLRQEDEGAIASADRLITSKDVSQRLAGLELLRQLAAAKRNLPACRERGEAYQQARKKLTREEETQLAAIAQSQKTVVSLLDALGLMNPAGRSPVKIPQKKKRTLISPAAIECLKSLDELVHEHREVPIKVDRFDGQQDELFGNVNTFQLPTLDESKPLAPQRSKLPLIEVWREWSAKRSAKEKDKDGLELLRAAFAVNLFYGFRDPSFLEKAKHITDQSLITSLLGEVNLPKFKHSDHIGAILNWLLILNPIDGSIDYLIDCIENSYAFVPAETHELLTQPPKEKPEFSVRYYPQEESTDWRRGNDYQRGDIFTEWTQFFVKFMNRQMAKLSKTQLKRYWELAHFADEPVKGASRHRPAFELVCKAVQAGDATLDDLFDSLLGPAPHEAAEGRSFSELSQLTSRQPEWEKTIQQTPGLADCKNRIIERILEIELARGETPTAATYPALALKSLHGIETLFRILEALASGKFKKSTSWREEGKSSRPGTLTHLLQITFPGEEDSQEEFNRRVKEGIAAGYLSQQRLLELAFLAPQWTKYVEASLDWPGFSEGLYWFVAHMNTGWRSSASENAAAAAGQDDELPTEAKPDKETSEASESTESEDASDEEEKAAAVAKRKKLSAWERLVLERTPLTAEERLEGAVDVFWFRRTWEELGETRWKQMAEAAKFAANSQQANKAQFLADVLLGNTSREELMENIKKRKLKEHVRLLGLLPLQEGAKRDADLRERYEVMQDYRKYARGLSSLSKPAAMRASEIGSQNLARLAGYADPLRLEWAMEAESVKDLAKGPVTLERDGVKVTLSLDAEAKPQLAIERAGKPLKTIPPQIKKKHAEIAELTERGTDLRRKASRMKWSLETAMCRGDTFTGTELQQLMDHAILAPLISRLVLIGEGIAGYPDKKGKALRDHQGKLEPVKAAEKLRIAHPYDLFTLGDWAKWQQECFRSERVQPFKQVFRELYPLTAQEKADGAASKRFAGQQIQPKQATALWGQRGWSTQDGICKIIHELSLVVDVSFLYGVGTAVEVEGWTVDSIRFRRRDEFQPIPLAKVPPILLSEIMRDLDLVVSVAHRGEVDPEASASTVEMRAALIRETCQLLGLKNVRLKGSHALIDGHFSQYSLHLGGGGVHRMPGGALCILPVHAQHRGRLFLPFADDDPRTAEVVSKILLLARDSEIQDPTILAQLGAPTSYLAVFEPPAAKASAKGSKKQARAETQGQPEETTAKAGEGGKRRFEFAEGASNKFWEIEIEGDQVTTRWGRLGTDGQAKTKSFGGAADAQKEFDELINEKTGKGYREV